MACFCFGSADEADVYRIHGAKYTIPGIGLISFRGEYRTVPTAMDNLVVGIVAAVALMVLCCSGYLWYLTSGVEKSERTSVDLRR
jgi:hypothetical protein